MPLIAKVTVTAMQDGQRRDFLPGEELPELPEHDVAALKAMNAIEDPAATAQAGKAADRRELAGQAEFAQARESVLAAQASIHPAPQARDKTAKAKG